MAYNRWLAVSRESIFVVRKKRKKGIRFDCQDEGEIRKTIPIANVQDVMITEPAGTAVCCFVPNVLNSVRLQTAAASGDDESPHHDASQAFLVGLRDPNRFRNVIMGLKKGIYIGKEGGPQAFQSPAVDAIGNSLRESASQGHDTQVLHQILDTLKSIDQKLDSKALVDVPGMSLQK